MAGSLDWKLSLMIILVDSYCGCIFATVARSMCNSNQKNDSHKSKQSVRLFSIPNQIPFKNVIFSQSKPTG